MNYKSYMIGGQWINHLLNATVVCLAYPYMKIDIKLSSIYQLYFQA